MSEDEAPGPSRRERRRSRRRTRRRRRRERLPRRVAVASGVVVAAVVVLNLLDTQVRTPVGAAGVGRGSFPVVEIAGLGSNGAHFGPLTQRLQARGTPVLDFDPDHAGIQPLTYRPSSSVRITSTTHIPDLATSYVEPQIRAALTRAGYDADHQRVDVVAHSMGGLLMRYLVEHPVGHWDRRVDDLVMVATPNHGSDVIWWETRPGNSPFTGLGADMRPGSAFLDSLGYREPPGEVYTTIGGDPWLFRWYRSGSHGFDDQVPAESPFLTGAALDTWPAFHGRLLLDLGVQDLILQTLSAHA